MIPSLTCFRNLFGSLFGRRKAAVHEDPTISTLETEELYPTFPPPPPRKLIENRTHHLAKLKRRRFAAPKGEKDDSPRFMLYRLYEHIVLDNNIGMRNELEAFWWTKVPVSEIPDPGDEGDLERYTILSCIPALLVESFNQRLEMGLRRNGDSIMSQEERDAMAATPKILETVPDWTKRVPPLEKTFTIPHSIAGHTQLATLEDKRASAPFKEKNILIWHPHIHFM